jgi:hypothetical protein
VNDKKIYTAYILDKHEMGTQLLRVAFEYPIVEYWAEPEEQAKLIAYFKANHFSHDEPIVIEESELFDYMPYNDKETEL